MSKYEMLRKIEQKRSELIRVASRNGLNSSLAIQYSQELDALLNQYDQQDLKKDRTLNAFQSISSS
ncbi:aspartyl-phosphate phosphatase Spo0E family protein [Bacillus fonticola]|uniref:aspartyl-phosphate phosphatase Spo0E family protein n=1 Tax=Bacillus fonticola TaxID=2728853 RepID=UPI001473B163|nr:aspartyl-phosphate phosphatase Spo0E family protein [Bacillus fonticola]